MNSKDRPVRLPVRRKLGKSEKERFTRGREICGLQTERQRRYQTVRQSNRRQRDETERWNWKEKGKRDQQTADVEGNEVFPKESWSSSPIDVAVTKIPQKLYNKTRQLLFLRINTKKYISTTTRDVCNIGVVWQCLRNRLASLNFSECHECLSCPVQRTRDLRSGFSLPFSTYDDSLSLLLCL